MNSMKYLLLLLLLIGCSEESKMDKRIEASKTRVADRDFLSPPDDFDDIFALPPGDPFAAPYDVEKRLDELETGFETPAGSVFANEVTPPSWAKFEASIEKAREQMIRGEGWMLGVCESMRKCDPEGFRDSNCASIIKEYGSKVPNYLD